MLPLGSIFRSIHFIICYADDIHIYLSIKLCQDLTVPQPVDLTVCIYVCMCASPVCASPLTPFFPSGSAVVCMEVT